ncbi:MAG TPA: WYL domain-containing protein [Polyangiaceae bacterium]|nr:WYL domain-containing protein [Polyangiaceae bacterium]
MPLRPIPRHKSSSAGRSPGKFTQSRRLDLLREKLETHTGGFTLEDLAIMLKVSTRSVRRYLNELGLVTELEGIELAPGAEKLWRIKPSERGRAVTLRRAQAYGLLAARRVFDVLKGSALFDEIDLALRQVEQVAHRPAVRPGVRGDVASDATGLEDRFAYVPAVPRAYGNRAEDVDAAFQAVADMTVLRFRYREPGADGAGGRPARLTTHPYALVLHEGAITCIARDVEHRTTRAFLFDRMSELLTHEQERFEVPDDFALDEWLHGDFGVARAQKALKVMVEFDARVADAVRARKVHPSQRLASAPDGRLRASLAVPASPDVVARVRAWVLGFGACARVLEPKELADEVALELRRAASRYGA